MHTPSGPSVDGNPASARKISLEWFTHPGDGLSWVEVLVMMLLGWGRGVMFVACALACAVGCKEETGSGGAGADGGAGGSGAEGGAGGSGAAGGGVGVDFTCPTTPPVPTRIATTFYTLPPPVSAEGYARIESIIVAGSDVYFTASDQNGPMLRTVTTDGAGESIAFQDPGFAPAGNLAGYGDTLFWFDDATDPGRVVGWPIGGGTPEVVFPDVLLGSTSELEQYFDADNNHFIHASVQGQAGGWYNQLLRRNASDGSIDVLFTRQNGVLAGGQQLAYGFLGDDFHITGTPDPFAQPIGVLLVAANSSPVDPVVPSAVLQTLERPCLTLVGLGSETLWCVGDVDIVGVPPNSIDEQVLRAMRYDAATGAYTWYELFDSYDQPDEPGRGFFATEVATNGPDLYFVAREVVDGTGEIVSTLYRARDAGTTFEVTTVLCDLPEITDMTLTNGSLYYATFEPDLAKLDRHGLWRLDL